MSEPSPADAPTRARRGRPGYDRDRVRAIAVELFNEQGYDATSVADVAQRLGLTKSALYHHFPSKDALLEVALDEALGGLEAAIDAASTLDAPAVDRLRHVIRAATDVLLAHLPSVTLLLRVRGNSAVEVAALERRRRFDQRVTAMVAAAQAEGDIRGDVDAPVVARLLFGMINSVVEWYRPGGAIDGERLGHDILAVILDGLRASDDHAVERP
jgi:AcrR family transcriptional regulator